MFCVVRTSGGIERDQAALYYVVMPRQEGSMLVVRPRPGPPPGPVTIPGVTRTSVGMPEMLLISTNELLDLPALA